MVKGKKGIVIGIANDHSIAWGIAKQLHASGAELAITYQNNTLLKRVKPLADKVNTDVLVECDVNNEDHLQNTFTQIKKRFGTIDFIIHAVAYSDKAELNGRYIDTSKDNFINSLSISCYSFTRIAKIFQPIINPDGSLLTLSFYGASKVMPNYNVMGVAKAALETSVKYLSVDLGGQDIRVNAISAGPMRTLAGAAIANARDVFNYTSENSSLKRNVNLDELGNSALYLVSDLSSAITGEIHYVDCGFNIVGMPKS
ncbi:MAG: SDR family oxidoreductase [Proteobacteria bacterium]|nr:SDR family oxidoreductase [Pseudomonadota bacterium]MDA1181201.1 SDR family oxidoreductase [Pseudomonadota bacterium]